jgi:hypothetical protein
LSPGGAGPEFSSGAPCPAGCAQSPALPGAAPALTASRPTSSNFAALPAGLLSLPFACGAERRAAFALFQRPPPSSDHPRPQHGSDRSNGFRGEQLG